MKKAKYISIKDTSAACAYSLSLLIQYPMAKRIVVLKKNKRAMNDHLCHALNRGKSESRNDRFTGMMPSNILSADRK
jgi:hypothetical protein